MEGLNLDCVKEGDKFALMSLHVSAELDQKSLDLSEGLSALPAPALELSEDWRARLGSIQVDDIQAAGLYLVARMPSQRPHILDSENQKLKDRVGYWLMGLRLKSKFTASRKPFIIQGSRINGKLDLRGLSTLDPPLGSIVEDHAPIGPNALMDAAQLATNIEAIAHVPPKASHWRLIRCLAIYRDARAENDICNRIHQFTRSLEGLIVPDAGKTRKQFISRTELFIGPRHHELMGEIYDARSHFEHLHEDRYLRQFDRQTRIRLAELEAVIEWIARSSLARILHDPTLTSYFGNVEAINQFWIKTKEEQKAIWGNPVDPLDMLRGFNFDSIRNEELGARR